MRAEEVREPAAQAALVMNFVMGMPSFASMNVSVALFMIVLVVWFMVMLMTGLMIGLIAAIVVVIKAVFMSDIWLMAGDMFVRMGMVRVKLTFVQVGRHLYIHC